MGTKRFARADQSDSGSLHESIMAAGAGSRPKPGKFVTWWRSALTLFASSVLNSELQPQNEAGLSALSGALLSPAECLPLPTYAQ
jgi:hypothetical protein